MAASQSFALPADFVLPRERSSEQPFASVATPRIVKQTRTSLEPLTLKEDLDLLDSYTSVPLSVDDLIYILNKCRKKGNIDLAKRAHKYIIERNMENHRELGNYLVPMYVECRSVADAKEVFDKLHYRNHYSWTALIQGYIECGECQQAFEVFKEMELNLVPPSKHTFLAMLKASILLRSIENSYKMHAHIAVEGFESDLFVGSTLVDMYSKQGRILEARHVFDNLPVRNAVSWTAIISGYADNGCGEEAIKCFEQMETEGVSMDAVTYLSGLKACCSSGFLEKGYVLHAEIVKDEIDSYGFIGSILVDMYLRCGLLLEAQEVFESMGTKDVVSWTTLIAGYVEHGLGKEALTCLEQMQNAGVQPNAYTFNCGLKACCIIGDTSKGLELHMEIVQESYEMDAFVGCALIDMYTIYGGMAEASCVFDELTLRDVVAWTAFITCYVELGYNEEALKCLKRMAEENIPPDAGTYSCSVKACSNSGNIDMGWQLHADISVDSLEKDAVVGSALLDMYATFNMVEEAQDVFDRVESQTVVTWTTLISAYLELGHAQKALKLYGTMVGDGILPDLISFRCSLKACGSLKYTREGQNIHLDIVKVGFEKESLIGNSLVDMYAKCGCFAEAKELFAQLAAPDVISWTALMTGYAEKGFGGIVLDCFWQMQLEGIPADTFSWNIFIAALVEQGEKESAFAAFGQMQEQGLLANTMTIVSMLKVTAAYSAFTMGKRIHTLVEGASGFQNVEGILGNVLIDMYCRCGMIENAMQIFDSAASKDIVTWNTLITGCGRLGEIDVGLSVFKRMKFNGINPDGITFVSILSLCSHAGLVKVGLKCFDSMRKDYGINANVEHHNCIIDLLGRAGRINDLIELLESKVVEPDIVTWSTILRSCNHWGHLELGTIAFNHIVRLDERNASAFIMLSNAYIDGEM